MNAVLTDADGSSERACQKMPRLARCVFPLRVTESDEASIGLVSVTRTSPFKGMADAGW